MPTRFAAVALSSSAWMTRGLKKSCEPARRPLPLFFTLNPHNPLFPIGLERSEIPTLCFHDVYAFTACRIHWSAVFDHVSVFHPGYEDRFTKAGHPGAFLLPHAVRRSFFEGSELSREFDLGWAGQTSGKCYQARAESCRNSPGNFAPTIGRAPTPSRKWRTFTLVHKSS